MLTRAQLEEICAAARTGHDRWRTDDAVRIYITYLRAEASHMSVSAGESRLREARAAAIEQRSARDARQLIPFRRRYSGPRRHCRRLPE